MTPEVARAYQGPPQSLGLPARLLDRYNPNPERMAPVVVDGFDQLRERHDEQVKNRDQLEDQVTVRRRRYCSPAPAPRDD